MTGANRGLERATAAALAAEAVQVWLGVRDTAAGEKVAREIGRGARVFTLDLDCPETLARLPEVTGPVDILVNNAGLAHVTPMIEDPKGFGTQMRMMVHAPYEFGLNNGEASDLAGETAGFSRHATQGFMGFGPKPCSFGPSHEAPSPPSRAGWPLPAPPRRPDRPAP